MTSQDQKTHFPMMPFGTKYSRMDQVKFVKDSP